MNSFYSNLENTNSWVVKVLVEHQIYNIRALPSQGRNSMCSVSMFSCVCALLVVRCVQVWLPSSVSLQGTKEDPAQKNKPTFLGKAGWVKKAHGRLLTSYKERYIHVEKTEVAVYDDEVESSSGLRVVLSHIWPSRSLEVTEMYFVLQDLQNCLERLDMENYEKCHELKSPFMKKHRLVLIRSPKSGNKVSPDSFT